MKKETTPQIVVFLHCGDGRKTTISVTLPSNEVQLFLQKVPHRSERVAGRFVHCNGCPAILPPELQARPAELHLKAQHPQAPMVQERRRHRRRRRRRHRG